VLRATLLICKAIVRDQRLRRLCMFWLIGIAVVMLFLGALLLSDRWGRAHPWLYIGYWAGCIWLTATGVLLALFDILVIRATARATRRRLEQELAADRLKGEGR
jgi:hypothetical protein